MSHMTDRERRTLTLLSWKFLLKIWRLRWWPYPLNLNWWRLPVLQDLKATNKSFWDSLQLLRPSLNCWRCGSLIFSRSGVEARSDVLSMCSVSLKEVVSGTKMFWNHSSCFCWSALQRFRLLLGEGWLVLYPFSNWDDRCDYLPRRKLTGYYKSKEEFWPDTKSPGHTFLNTFTEIPFGPLYLDCENTDESFNACFWDRRNSVALAWVLIGKGEGVTPPWSRLEPFAK